MGIGDMLQAEQDAEDAARYRWLRKQGCKFPEPIGCMSDLLLDKELDRAIDVYMRTSGKGEGK